MIIDCDVSVISDARFTCNERPRYSRAKIGVAYDSNQSPVLVVITHQTKHKFKIIQNCAVLSSSTIRFKTPPTLVYMRANESLLIKAMIRLIDTILRGITIPKLSSVESIQKLKPMPTSLAINGKNYDPNDLKNKLLTKLVCDQLKLIPRLVWKLNQLIELRLTSCELTEIPSKIMDLCNTLKILDLSRNNIDTIDGSFVVAMEQLRHFDISHNKLSYLPFELKIMRFLEHLNVSHNQLSHLPFTIGRIATLKRLDMSHNNLDCIPMSFVKQLSNTVRLSSLDVSHNSFSRPFHSCSSHHSMPSQLMPTLKCLSASAILSNDCTLYSAHKSLPKMLYTFIEMNGEMCSDCGSVIVSKEIKGGVIRQCFELITDSLSTSHFQSFPLFPCEKYLCYYCHNLSVLNHYLPAVYYKGLN